MIEDVFTTADLVWALLMGGCIGWVLGLELDSQLRARRGDR